MRIAIIGTGNVGTSLAAAAVTAGHQVVVTAAHPENAEKVAAETGATAAATPADAAREAEVVVLAVPAAAAADVIRNLGDTRAVVVDATNPLDETFSGLTTNGTSQAELLAAAAPGTRVVKAFNTILAARLTAPEVDGRPLDGYLAGDDDAAKATVAELVTSLGFRAIDAGGLRMARSLEELALLGITLNIRNGWSWQTGWSLAGPTN